MTDNDETALEELREGNIAFRLRDETTVFKQPDASGEVIAVLPPGALITVREEAGHFLHVVTPQDSFGFIAASTPVLDVEPPVETPIETVTQVAPASPAGELFLRQMASGTPMTAAQLTGTGARPHMAGDDTFELARPLEASERVLIYDRIAANKRSTILLMGTFIAFLSLFFLAIGHYLSYYGGVAPGGIVAVSPDEEVGVPVAVVVPQDAVAVGVEPGLLLVVRDERTGCAQGACYEGKQDSHQ
jgi:hypothetical protein